MRTIQTIFVSLITLCVTIYHVNADAVLQPVMSATPVPANIPSPLPIVITETIVITSTEVVRTATPIGPVMLEALTEANVRSQPDPESERLGTIRAGDQYVVIGRYFRWFQFQYNQTTSGIGWVFDELVTITGDETTILDLAASELPGQDGSLIDAPPFVAQTPGGILTVTAATSLLPLPISTVEGRPAPIADPLRVVPEILPTFTFPPHVPLLNGTSTLFTTVDPNAFATEGLVRNELAVSPSIPPILPILILGGLGILGIIVNSSRSQ